MNIVAIIAIMSALLAIAVTAHRMGNEERTTRIKCTDLMTGGTVICRVRHVGIVTPLNRKMLIEHARAELQGNGIIPNRMTIID